MRFLQICCFLAGFHSLYGQSFNALPGVLLEQHLAFNAANECYIHFDDNNITDSLHLYWRLADASIPQEWNIDLCDYGACYTGIPNGKKMQPAPDSAQPYLKLLVNTGTTPGEAWIWFRVYKVSDPNDFLDVYFDLITDGVNAVNASPVNITSAAFPNPVTNTLFVQENSGDQRVRITDMQGRVFFNGPINGLSTIDVTAWSSGTYYIHGPHINKLVIKQ